MTQARLLFVLIVILLGAFFQSPAVGKAPNIVVFISDDLGRSETSVYGSKQVRTPNLDKLAARGMTFDNAYVASPSCCPNRYSFLTGLMPARHGAHPNHSKPIAGTKYLLPILKGLGYHVASFGKVSHGRGTYEGVDFCSPPPRDMSKALQKHFTGRKSDQPICLLVGDRRPHVAWTKDSIYDPDTVTLPPYFIDTKETREHWARYLSDITGMDEELGRVLDLAKKRFGDDFIFLFTSDHGGQWHMGKWTLYDSGTRVPLLVSWPGRIAPGVRTDAMVSWVDLLPTLIRLAGGIPPGDIDGRSFDTVLSGKTKAHRDRIFTTHTGDGEMNVFPIRSVRIGSFKYIHNLRPDAWFTNHSDRHRKDGAGAFWDSWDAAAKKDPKAADIVRRYYTRPEFEFFDRAADPMELHNLVEEPEHQETIVRFRSELAEWTRSQGDTLLPHREPYPRVEPIPNLIDPRKK